MSRKPVALRVASVALLLAVSLVPAVHGQTVPPPPATPTPPTVTPAIVTSTDAVALTEGGPTVIYKVHLNTPPTATVTVTVGSLGGQVRFLNATGAAVASIALSFDASPTALNDQTVTAVAFDDAVVEGTQTDTITNKAASTDTNYNNLAKSVTATITDNDAGLAVTQAAGGTHVNEKPVAGAGDVGHFSVLLGSAPTATVSGDFAPGSQLSLDHLHFQFTAATWKTPQAFTVYAIDDHVAQGPRTVTLSAPVSSADPAYDGRTVSLAVTITDDDAADFRFALPAGADGGPNALPAVAAFDEGTGTSYRVHLDSQPTAPVVLTPSGPAALSFAPASLTFTAANWNTPQTVTVTDADDHIDQGASYTLNVLHAVSSADASYAAIALAPLTLTLNDQVDVANVLLTHPGGGSPAVAEGGATDTVNVVLATQPVAPITVALSAPSDVTFSPASLTFTSANWNTPQSSTVAALDDNQASLDRTVTATATGSGDGQYNTKTATLTVNVADNDGVLVLSKASLSAVEGGSDTFTVHLVAEPPSDVTVSLASSRTDEFTVSPVSLVFRHSSAGGAQSHCAVDQNNPQQAKEDCTWNVNRTVTVRAVDDNRIDGTQLNSVLFTVGGGGTSFNGKAPRPLPVSTVDNDVAGLVLSASSINANEGGAAATYTVRLATQPTADVTVTATGSGDVQASGPLTFTVANWNTPQAVSVTARNDDIDKGTSYANTVANAASSADAHYNLAGGAVTVMVTDNDEKGYLFTNAAGQTLAVNTLPSLTIPEAGSATYSLRLQSQPTADVTVTMAPDSGVTVSPASLTFTAATWNTPQSVAVTVPDNQVQQGAGGAYDRNIGQAAASGDPLYSSIPSPIQVHVTADDTAALVVGQTGGSTVVQEGGQTDTVTVALATQPTAGVTVTLTVPQGAQVSPASLSFTPASWGTAQTVTVTATDDSTPEFTQQSTLAASAASADSFYSGKTASVQVTVLDNDGVLNITKSGNLAVTEGGATASYTVQLIQAPTSEVTVTISSEQGQVLFAPDATSAAAATLQLKFEPSNPASATVQVPCTGNPTKDCRWNNPQTVLVSAMDDQVPEHPVTDIIDHAVASTDAHYSNVPTPPVPVAVSDNDAALFVTDSGSSTAVTEGGAADTYTLSLSTPPTASVTVTLSTDSRVAVSPATLYFDSFTWDTPKTVTVSVPDDHLDQPDVVTYAIHHALSSYDAAYNGLAAPDANVAVTDDDSSALIVAQSGGSTIVKEGGPGDAFTVRLATQPASSVTVTMSPDPQVTLSPSQLTFTPANWNTAQSVAVSAVEDSIAYPPHNVEVGLTVSSADTGYSGLAVPAVSVEVKDNDKASVMFNNAATSMAVTEGGAGTTYSIRLTSQPSGDVVVSITPDAQLTLGRSSVTFTPANWGTYQIVSVAAVDDNVHEGPHTGTIVHGTSSTDPMYQGLSPPTLIVNITDNDP